MNTNELNRIKKHNKQREYQNVLELLQSISHDNLDMSVCDIINKSMYFANIKLKKNDIVPVVGNTEFSDILMDWWINGEDTNI